MVATATATERGVKALVLGWMQEMIDMGDPLPDAAEVVSERCEREGLISGPLWRICGTAWVSHLYRLNLSQHRVAAMHVNDAAGEGQERVGASGMTAARGGTDVPEPEYFGEPRMKEGVMMDPRAIMETQYRMPNNQFCRIGDMDAELCSYQARCYAKGEAQYRVKRKAFEHLALTLKDGEKVQDRFSNTELRRMFGKGEGKDKDS